jgi:hypothetical protein
MIFNIAFTLLVGVPLLYSGIKKVQYKNSAIVRARLNFRKNYEKRRQNVIAVPEIGKKAVRSDQNGMMPKHRSVLNVRWNSSGSSDQPIKKRLLRAPSIFKWC